MGAYGIQGPGAAFQVDPERVVHHLVVRPGVHGSKGCGGVVKPNNGEGLSDNLGRVNCRPCHRAAGRGGRHD